MEPGCGLSPVGGTVLFGGVAARDSMDVAGKRCRRSLSERSKSETSSFPDSPEDSICDDFLRDGNLGNEELRGSGELDSRASRSAAARLCCFCHDVWSISRWA